MTASEMERIQCMEVWGGNQSADLGVMMLGLDAWVYSKPYGDASAGGDVYYVSSCATGRITRLLLADVSGHGEAVSAIATTLRNLMRKYVNYLDQSKCIHEMNQQFAELSHDESFATTIVITFFSPTNDLTVCNAGHPPPLLYRAAQRQWTFLEQRDVVDAGPANIPLGVADMTNYDQFSVRLHVGDLVLCYTDALIESCDAEGQPLGRRGLHNMVKTIDASESMTFIPTLLDNIQRQADGNLTNDDATVLLFRPNGMGQRLPLREKLLVPGRLLRGWIGSFQRDGQPMPWPELSLPNIGGAIFHAFNRSWTHRNQQQGRHK
jgi:sigma-B regulation protein RsbU (phosphoserine phosphatase)